MKKSREREFELLKNVCTDNEFISELVRDNMSLALRYDSDGRLDNLSKKIDKFVANE
jgi:hypothetical protein